MPAVPAFLQRQKRTQLLPACLTTSLPPPPPPPPCRVFLRAIGACPWSKGLWCDGLALLNGHVPPKELSGGRCSLLQACKPARSAYPSTRSFAALHAFCRLVGRRCEGMRRWQLREGWWLVNVGVTEVVPLD